VIISYVEVKSSSNSLNLNENHVFGTFAYALFLSIKVCEVPAYVSKRGNIMPIDFELLLFNL